MIYPSLMSVCLRHQARKQTETIKRELLKLARQQNYNIPLTAHVFQTISTYV
jgi:hypothetical protein